MDTVKSKVFCLDDDTVEVPLRLDEESGRYFGYYPDFESQPRYTPSGKLWVNATTSGCPFAAGEYDDCGSCSHMMRAGPGDLIGICTHDATRRSTKQPPYPTDAATDA